MNNKTTKRKYFTGNKKLKHVQMFEDFSHEENGSPLEEGMMSELDIIGKEAETKEDFITDAKKFLAGNAHDPKVADNEDFLEELASTYFNSDGSKKISL